MLVHYNGGDKEALDEFNSWLKLSDLVIRHMIVRLKNKPDIIEKTDNDLSLDSEKEESGNKEKIDDNKEQVPEKIEGVE